MVLRSVKLLSDLLSRSSPPVVTVLGFKSDLTIHCNRSNPMNSMLGALTIWQQLCQHQCLTLSIESHLCQAVRPTYVWGVLSPSWSLTKIQPVQVTKYKAFSPLCQADKPNYLVRFLGSALDLCTQCPSGEEFPQIPLIFQPPKFETQIFVITHWNSHSVAFRFVAITG